MKLVGNENTKLAAQNQSLLLQVRDLQAQVQKQKKRLRSQASNSGSQPASDNGELRKVRSFAFRVHLLRLLRDMPHDLNGVVNAC